MMEFAKFVGVLIFTGFMKVSSRGSFIFVIFPIIAAEAFLGRGGALIIEGISLGMFLGKPSPDEVPYVPPFRNHGAGMFFDAAGLAMITAGIFNLFR